MANILVLDDVLDATVLVGKILTKKGHSVHTFTEEEEALAFASANAVDLAILDIKLKKMSGVEVLAELKKINAKMQAIMLTGYPTVETAREAINLGADEYCVKPIDRQELEDKVEKVLKSKAKKSQLTI
ncbi:MAG: response regulator [Desulfofustis sp.]|jgi:DNA-binding NtrC family response regulator|nr:response regulator [Desulfofustis sp.]